MIRCVGREVKIESVPPRVARAALQLDETGVNGSSFHAQTGRIRHNERGLGLVQIPRRLGPLQRHRATAGVSSNKARHRLSRSVNRQLNAALHRIALTQARCIHRQRS